MNNFKYLKRCFRFWGRSFAGALLINLVVIGLVGAAETIVIKNATSRTIYLSLEDAICMLVTGNFSETIQRGEVWAGRIKRTKRGRCIDVYQSSVAIKLKYRKKKNLTVAGRAVVSLKPYGEKGIVVDPKSPFIMAGKKEKKYIYAEIREWEPKK